MEKIITNSEQETFNWAKNYAQNLKGGEIICLSGDLGAGKTIFTKGLAAGLGITNNVNSPTFVIMKIYSIKNKKIKNLCHIDAYRLKSAEDIKAIGAEEYFGRNDTITVIEWPENIKKIIPTQIIEIKISNQKINTRQINIK